MTRSQRIKTIVRLSENKERTAAREFAAAQKTLNDFKDRLNQLKGYRQEYLGFLKPGLRSQSINVLREHQAFILHIDEGIRQLSEQIKIQENMNSQERDKWLKQKKQLDTMENIHDRFRRTEQHIAAMREQSQLEEAYLRSPAK